MKINIDFVLAGIAVATVGGGWFALSAHSSTTEQTLEQRFTEQDFAAFDRDFTQGDTVCDVGLQSQDICFRGSHLETNIVKGEPFPANMYPLALEWRATLETERKDPSLKTVRIGKTIALMERETRTVVDTMRLEAVNFADATGGQQG